MPPQCQFSSLLILFPYVQLYIRLYQRLNSAINRHSSLFLLNSFWFVFAFLKAKPHDTLDLCGILNDDLAATVKRYPKRFVGLGTLPMQAPDLAVEEMRRCVNQLGFPGVQIGSHINTWDLNAPELYPVYAVSPFAFGSTCHSTLNYLVSFVIILSSSYSVLSQFVGHLKTRNIVINILHLTTGRWGTRLLNICASMGHADRWQNGKILAALVSWWVWLIVFT